MLSKRKKNGFTFVELMAVIVVLGVILVLVVPSLIGNMNEAKEEVEIVFVKNIGRSIEQYIETHKKDFKLSSDVTDNKSITIGSENITLYKVKKKG